MAIRTPPSEEIIDDVPRPRTPPMEEIIPDKDEDDDREPPRPPTPPMEEIIPEKEPPRRRRPPRPRTPPMEEIIPGIPLLEVKELPEGRQWESEPGMIEVVDPQSGMTSWRKTPTGYIQLGGETYETRWQPFIPTTPSKELREALGRMPELEGEAQFRQAEAIGFIPIGSLYIPREEGEWTYLPANEVRRLQDESPELYKILDTKGWDAYQRAYQAEIETQRLVSEDAAVAAARAGVALETYEEFQSKVASGEIIAVGNGEYAYAESKGSPSDLGYILGYNDMPENWQDYANEYGMIALIDKLQTGTFIPYSAGNLDKIMAEGTWHEKSYINSAITAIGLFEEEELDIVFIGPGAPPPSSKKWEDLTPEEKQMVADNYQPPGTWIAETTKWLEEWGGVKKPTIGKVSDAVHNMGIIGENRAIASNIAGAMIDAGVPVSAISPKGTHVPMEAVAESWDKLSETEKQRVIEYYKTTTERIADFQIKVAEATEDWLKFWEDEDPEVWREIKALPKGLFEIVQGITVGIGGSVLKSFTSLIEGHPKSSVVQLSEIPIGMAQWATIESSARIAEPLTPGIGLLVGNLSIPIALKGIKGTIGGTRTAYRMGETFVKKGILPRAYKGGGLDVYRIRVPEGFERLTSELDVIARDKAQVKAIFESGLSRAEQTARVREQLNPETRVIYDNYMSLIDEVSKFKAPESMIRDVNFGDITRMPRESVDAIKMWMQENAGDIKIHGSFADWVQTKGIKDMWRPNDLDLNVAPKGKLTPEMAAEQLAKVIRESSGEPVRAIGGSVEVLKDGKWTKLFDIHYEGEFAALPYRWATKKPIVIEGIPFEQLGEQMFRRGEQIINPGVGRVSGLMGPEAAQRPWRLKDVYRFQTEVRGIIDVLREQGKTEIASKLERVLDFIEEAPRGEPLPITAEKGVALQREFIELVDELQGMALERGVDVLLEHRLGMLSRYISPAGREIKGTIYHATRDINAYVRTLREKGYIEAGRYIDEQGNWVKVPREDLFTSPDLAFDRLYDFYKGKIPENAGVVAIRTIAEDIGKGKTVEPAFRVEYITEKGKEPYPVVYDELLFTEGSRAYPTDPTGFSLRKGSISEGLTGEVFSFHPRVKEPISVLYFVTEGARKAGLSAPNLAQIRSMNLLAIRAMLADLLHPRLPKRFVTTAEPIKGASIIEFYRDTYKWKGKSKAEVAKAVAEQDKVLLKEATDNLKAKGKDKLPPEEYAKALDEELNIVASKKGMEALSDKDIQRMLRDFSIDEITRTYYLNLREIYSQMAAAGLGAATAGISAITKADVPTIPTLVSRIPSEVLETIAPRITPVGIVAPALPTEVPTPIVEITAPPTIPISVTEPTPEPTPTLIPTPTPTPTITPVTEFVFEPVTLPVLKPVEEVVTKPLLPPPLPKVEREVERREEREYPPGTVVWVQGRPYGGAMYKVLPPPYREEDMFTTRDTPPGYEETGISGEGSAQKTLQVIGEALAENVENIDLGWARININVDGGIPKIEFIQDVEANVGLRHKTVGMGEGQIPIDVWKEAKEQGIPYEDFVRDYKGELVGERHVVPMEAPKPLALEEREAEEVGELVENKIEPIEVEQETVLETPEPLEAKKVSPLDIPMLLELEERETEGVGEPANNPEPTNTENTLIEEEPIEEEPTPEPEPEPEPTPEPEPLPEPKPKPVIEVLSRERESTYGSRRMLSEGEMMLPMKYKETSEIIDGVEHIYRTPIELTRKSRVGKSFAMVEMSGGDKAEYRRKRKLEEESDEEEGETLEPLEMELGSPLDIRDPFEQEERETEEVGERTSEPTIVMVDSWRDIPVLDANSNLKAYHDPNTNTIYAIKGVTTRAEMEHEIGHSKMGHEDVPQDPVVFVRHEFEAHKYAYDKIGEPKNLLMKYRGILNDLIKHTYSVKPQEAMQIMESELEKVSPPQEWKKDFAKLTDEFEQMYGKAEEEPLPVTIGTESFPTENRGRPKKPKNMKNWWESDFYSNEAEQRVAIVPERRYLNHKLLPPDLGGSL